MPSPPIISLTQVGLVRGTGPLFTNVDLHIYPRDRIAIVGPNGAGKSSLMSCIASSIPPDQGTYFLKPGTRIGMLDQDTLEPGPDKLRDRLSQGMDDTEFGRLDANFTNLGLTGDEIVADCSGGQIRRAQLARCLSLDVDLLMLDEPTNHLDLAVIGWLEEHLTSRREAILLISHDRAFLEKLSKRLFWVDRGTIRVREAGYEDFDDIRAEQFRQEEEEARLRKRKLKAEEDWMRYGVTARRKRNVRRADAYQDLKSEVRQDRRIDLLPDMVVGGDAQTGQKVCSFYHAGFSFNEHVIVAPMDLDIKRGERLALVGPNGVGKTTLLKLITGDLKPHSGKVKLGANVTPVLVDQMREGLRLDHTVQDNVTGGAEFLDVAGERLHYQRYLSGFGLAPNRHHLKVGALSGGERARVLLAKRLLNPSGFLLLDEPTNDLDIDTIERLEDMIEKLGLTMVFVSHDRRFVESLATGLLVFKGAGIWQREAGNDMARHFQTHEQEKSAPQNAKKSKPAEPKKKPSQAKMSYKDKRELDLLPELISKLETQIQYLEQKLADPDLFVRDPTTFNASSLKLEHAQKELQSKEERWLELEAVREELEEAN